MLGSFQFPQSTRPLVILARMDHHKWCNHLFLSAIILLNIFAPAVGCDGDYMTFIRQAILFCPTVIGAILGLGMGVGAILTNNRSEPGGNTPVQAEDGDRIDHLYQG
jgi:hypothetical protein